LTSLGTSAHLGISGDPLGSSGHLGSRSGPDRARPRTPISPRSDVSTVGEIDSACNRMHFGLDPKLEVWWRRSRRMSSWAKSRSGPDRATPRTPASHRSDVSTVGEIDSAC